MTTTYKQGDKFYYRHPVHGYMVCKIIGSVNGRLVARDEDYTYDGFFLDTVCDYDIRTEREYMIDYVAQMMGIDTEKMIAYCDENNIQ